MPTTLFDGFGRPAEYRGTSAGSGVLYARSPEDERLRPRAPNHFDDYLYLLGTWPWQRLVSESRAIGSRGLVAAALLQKADYLSSTDWRTYFAGEDNEYGDQTEELMDATNHLVCTRGPRYDWATLWKLGFLSAATDGGFFLLLTKSEQGWPLYQPLEAHRIGQRDMAETVEAGSATTTIRDEAGEPVTISTPYEGLRIINGIIYNRVGAEVAYRVLGPTPDEDEDVSARDMIHVGPPRWFSEGRPAPQIAPGFLSLLAVDLASSSQLDQQIIDSRLTVINQNGNGRQDPAKQLLNQDWPGSGFSPVGDPNSNPELVVRGQFAYIKNGNNLTPWQSARPSDQWMNFDERQSARAVAACGWRLEMLDPSGLRGGSTRAFQDQINTLIKSSFKAFQHAVLRADRYRVACLTNIGQLPVHAEFMKRGITEPAEFVVDRNSLTVDISAVRAGADSMPNLHRRAGMRSKQVLNDQARYLFQRAKAAARWSRDGVRIEERELGTTLLPRELTRVDEIGGAVKSGVLTASPEVEKEVREDLNLPPMGPETQQAWQENGTRMPASVNTENETQPAQED